MSSGPIRLTRRARTALRPASAAQVTGGFWAERRVQGSWRMALLTGEAKYSDLVERTLYNGFLAGVGLDGTRWLYVNPLQVRDEYEGAGEADGTARRTPWFRCACCPPNAMRLLAALPHYLASGDRDGLQLHQYATGVYAAAGSGWPPSTRGRAGSPSPSRTRRRPPTGRSPCGSRPGAPASRRRHRTGPCSRRAAPRPPRAARTAPRAARCAGAALPARAVTARFRASTG